VALGLQRVVWQEQAAEVRVRAGGFQTGVDAHTAVSIPDEPVDEGMVHAGGQAAANGTQAAGNTAEQVADSMAEQAAVVRQAVVVRQAAGCCAAGQAVGTGAERAAAADYEPQLPVHDGGQVAGTSLAGRAAAVRWAGVQICQGGQVVADAHEGVGQLADICRAEWLGPVAGCYLSVHGSDQVAAAEDMVGQEDDIHTAGPAAEDTHTLDPVHTTDQAAVHMADPAAGTCTAVALAGRRDDDVQMERVRWPGTDRSLGSGKEALAVGSSAMQAAGSCVRAAEAHSEDWAGQVLGVLRVLELVVGPA
jgi:hypothetical protein